MSQFREMADGLKALEKQYRAVLKAGEFLAGVADLAQVEQEAQRRAERAKADAEIAAAILLDTTGALERRHAELEQAKAGIATAKAAAEAEAQAVADRVMAREQERLETITGAIAHERETLEAAVAQRTGVEAEIVALEAKRVALEEQVQALKQAAAAIAGG